MRRRPSSVARKGGPLMIAAIVLFAWAASGGLLLARQRVLDRPPLSLLHGALVACGFVALALGDEGAAGSSSFALVSVVVAALGGSLLFSMTRRKKPIAIPVVAAHAVVAAAALVVLIVGAVKAS